jgi:type I restriction enzyme, R subunit
MASRHYPTRSSSLSQTEDNCVPISDMNCYGDASGRIVNHHQLRADIEITDDMLRLHPFKIEQVEAGSASLAAGDAMPLAPIKEFAAKPYTAEEEI